MEMRHGWLFPMMVVAAGSVIAFGCVGIAAITGYIPLSRTGPNPLGDYALPSAMTSPLDSDFTTHRLARADAAVLGASGTPAGAAGVTPIPISRTDGDTR
jgi:hypothetical protein